MLILGARDVFLVKTGGFETRAFLTVYAVILLLIFRERTSGARVYHPLLYVIVKDVICRNVLKSGDIMELLASTHTSSISLLFPNDLTL